jgi:hypothetical protein
MAFKTVQTQARKKIHWANALGVRFYQIFFKKNKKKLVFLKLYLYICVYIENYNNKRSLKY